MYLLLQASLVLIKAHPHAAHPRPLRRYLPFADQYLRSLRLWAPDSSAFCFASRGRPSGEDGR